MSDDVEISNEVLFNKVLELQEALTKAKTEQRLSADKKDREAELELCLRAKATEIAKLKEQIRAEDYTMREMLKIRDMVAVAFDLYKGDGWAGWKRIEGEG